MTRGAVEVVSFGCRLNTLEAEVMRGEADAAGLGLDGRRTVLLNTCAVTAEAVRQARQAVRRARREDPDARIVVTGCGAELETEAYAAMPEVTRLVGNAEKLSSTGWSPSGTRPTGQDTPNTRAMRSSRITAAGGPWATRRPSSSTSIASA